jgi:hypothetical protein
MLVDLDPAILAGHEKRMSILREVFGPSRKEVWQQLSSEIGGSYFDGGFWKGDKVQAVHGQWVVTLDIYRVSTGKSTIAYTRMRAPYINPDRFRFIIYREGIFSAIGKWLGMQDIEVGFPEFDGQFVVKGRNVEQVRRLFDNPRLRELIARQPQIHLTVNDNEGFFGPDFPADTDELCFAVAGVIQDVEQLKALFELFAETLDQLCRIGSAYEEAPGVRV